MKLLINKLSILRTARFLQAKVDGMKVVDIEFLENGQNFRDQIENQWRCMKITTDEQAYDYQISKQKDISFQNYEDFNPRIQFVYSPLFRQNMKNLNSQTLKIKLNTKYDLPKELQFKDTHSIPSIQLITDHFFHAASSLAKFYNIQRERKIWWMRISADPSRYYLEPFELNCKNNTANNIPNAQSITIKAHHSFGDLSVEHITLVPLNEATLENKSDFEIYNKRTNKRQLPAVIRSVVDLDVATCALLFDATANSKRENTLFLNRKLSPYQCLITSFAENHQTNDLKDLCTHLTNVIKRAGLRILDDRTFCSNYEPFCSPLELADNLGVPYTLLVNSNSLSTGLLKLRSRDTTLEETIHISDIPGYLLNIFRAT